ncbi:SMC-Scp complex subunit ScpB [Propioniciclava tarda]|uniref:SMC-Scp complex subunit ScpB n=1 Tax=Propioniciclava tarda TaxID=433330 RepID=A0A4V2JT21_PROTD|nr:SMC-Scp complex subunit ScpB [Propioniciclava tarda]TBT94551.1 SMC-Scp complex subunit ScpB [Propioniciclava tarda]SMO68577.1 segregation and condensation protein B [Propioniciclava tarda]HOA87862.1 SMC-Scp complex subunit ScpB [Propioniciclava tarda]HQA30004.1 SMC-Scp complex subunit ScpB [Propioniciclava tarda]HQD59640.1 SMC-Scp complex subunit ScpB [Propioniciclava tarda]
MTEDQAAAAASEETAKPADGFDIDPSTITGPLEALLFMATEPMPTAELAQALDVPKPVVWQALDELRAFYDTSGRGFELREVGTGWRYYTRPEHHDVIARWLLEGQHGRLSQAALETLAVIAYLQPISRSRVSAVRGVNVDGVVRTLVTRELIEETARDPETGAMLFSTTATFLEKMGLTSLDQLPPIAPHLPEASALEAELSGLASLADLGEDATMTSSPSSPNSAPPPEVADEWADEQVAESQAHAEDDARRDVAIPDAAELDRLSDPA